MNLPNLDLLGTLGIGAGLTALVAGWQQVKGFFSRLMGLFIITIEMQEYAGEAAQLWFGKRTTRAPTSWLSRSFLFYFGMSQFIRPKAIDGAVIYERLGTRGRIVWHKRVPVWVQLKTKGSGGDSNQNTTSGSDRNAVVFRFIRGTINPDDLAFDIGEAFDPVHRHDHSSRFAVFRLSGRSNKITQTNQMSSPEPDVATGSSRGTAVDLVAGRLVGWKKSDIGEDTELKNPVGRLALTPPVEAVVERIRRWSKAKDWYLARQIPWRLGCLFYGVPGTGKSSLVKAIAQELSFPIYLLDISTMDNGEFHSSYRRALTNTPCVVLIEDIDAVFHGRENIANELGKGLTFDCLLNTVSGVETSDGVLLVVTTNHLDLVDPALGVPEPGSLSTRPGRIDCTVELPILTAEGRRKLALRILNGCHESWVDYMVAEGTNDTGAQFEDRCANIALNLFWSSNPQQPAPDHTADAEKEAA